MAISCPAHMFSFYIGWTSAEILGNYGKPFTLVVMNTYPRKYWWPIVTGKAVRARKLATMGDTDALLLPSKHGWVRHSWRSLGICRTLLNYAKKKERPLWFILLDMIETKQPELYSSPGAKQGKKQEVKPTYVCHLARTDKWTHYNRELNKSLNEITSSEIIPSYICLCLYK